MGVSITNEEFITLYKTVYGEARGEHEEGKRAVAHVIFNRVRAKSWYGKTVEEVCKKPYQFSCWNGDDPNRALMDYIKPTSDKVIRRCIRATINAIEDMKKNEDPSNGATHYHVNTIAPKWAEGKSPCAIIGRHLFYKDID